MFELILAIGFVISLYFFEKHREEKREINDHLEKLIEFEAKKAEIREEIRGAKRRKRMILDQPDWASLSKEELAELDEIEDLLERENEAISVPRIGLTFEEINENIRCICVDTIPHPSQTRAHPILTLQRLSE